MAAVTDDGRAVMECRVTRVADGFLIRFLVPPGTIMPNVHVDQVAAGGRQPSPAPAAPVTDPRFDQARRNAERVGLLGRLNKLGAKKPEHIVNAFDPADIGWAIDQFKLQGKKVDNVAAYLTSMIRYRKK